MWTTVRALSCGESMILTPGRALVGEVLFRLVAATGTLAALVAAMNTFLTHAGAERF